MMAKGDETDNVANLSNVNLNDIKKYISKYRTLPLSKKQDDASSLQNTKSLNVIKQAMNNRNISQEDKISDDNAQQYTYRSRQNYRQGNHRASTLMDIDEPPTDNEYINNLQTAEHARKLDVITEMITKMNEVNQRAVDLVEVKRLVVETINNNLERNNLVENTAYNQIAQDVYNKVKSLLTPAPEKIEKKKSVIPSDFKDPISLEIMEDPVITKCGHTFEKGTLNTWLQTNNYCPTCRVNVNRSQISNNYAVKSMIENYIKNGGYSYQPSSSASSSINNTDTLGLLNAIEGELTGVKAEMSTIKKSVDRIVQDYSSLNTRMASTLNRSLMEKKGEFTKEMLENQAKIISKLETQKVSYSGQKETIKKLDEFLAQLGRQSDSNRNSQERQLTELTKNINNINNTVSTISSTVNAQSTINSQQIIKTINANIKSIMQNTANNNNTNILQLTSELNQALRLANSNQQLAVQKKADNETIKAIKDTNKMILELTGNFENRFSNIQASIESGPQRLATEGPDNRELLKQVKELSTRSEGFYSQLISLQDGGSLNKKAIETLNAFSNRISELIDNNNRTARMITDGDESIKNAILERFNTLQSRLYSVEQNAGGLSSTVTQGLLSLNENIQNINTDVNSRVLAITDSVQDRLATSNESLRSQLELQGRAYLESQKKYQLETAQNIMLRDDEWMERLSQMLKNNSNDWVGALEERTEQLQIAFNKSLETFPFQPTIREIGEITTTTTTNKTVSLFIPTDSNTNVVNSTTNSQNLEISEIDVFTNEVDIMLYEHETDENKVFLLEIGNEIKRCVKAAVIIDYRITRGLDGLEDISERIRKYNYDFMRKTENLNAEMVAIINDTTIDKSVRTRELKKYSEECARILSDCRNEDQLNNLYSKLNPLTTINNGVLNSAIENSLDYLKSVYTTTLNKLTKQENRGSAPVSALNDEPFIDDIVPNSFVPDNGNVNLQMRINPATEQTETLNASLLAPEPIVQLYGSLGGKDVIKDEYGRDVANKVREFLELLKSTSIDQLNREELEQLIQHGRSLQQTNYGDQTEIPLTASELYNLQYYGDLIDAAYARLESSDSQYPQEEKFEPPGTSAAFMDINEENVDEENESIVPPINDYKRERSQKRISEVARNRKKSLIEGRLTRNEPTYAVDDAVESKESTVWRPNYVEREKDKKKTKKNRKNVNREIETDKAEIGNFNEDSTVQQQFVDEESKKRRDSMFKGNGVHHSLKFRRKLLSLIKSGHVKTKKRGAGVSKKLVCSLCNNDKDDDNYHITKSKEVLHKKCFEGRGMTKKRKLYEEDYGEDITPESNNREIRTMYENHSDARQKELIDKVKLNNVHSDHMQSVSNNNSLSTLIKNSRNSYIAWGQVDSKLFSLMCYLLGVMNNNKENASQWDYINYQVLRAKYLLSHKADPKKLKYIDVDTSNQASIEKAVKSNPAILFDFDFNE